MNDFTKEELEEIMYLFTHGFGPNIRSLTIPKKIQSMIDNYCAHNSPYTKLGITVCLDCNEVVNENQ